MTTRACTPRGVLVRCVLAAACVGLLSTCATSGGGTQARAPLVRNAILFVADGLRRGSVDATRAPALLSVREQGTDFANSHALFPTFTTPNASGIATGHELGDTGDYSNTVYPGFPIFNIGAIAGKSTGTQTPFLENDQVLADVDAHFANRNYLDEESLLALARAQGFATAAIGKLGPVALQDVTQLSPSAGVLPVPTTVFIDDSTGTPSGIPLSPPVVAALAAAGLPAVAPPRTQPAGDVVTPGALAANIVQQQYFADALTKALLPMFKASGKPFVVVFWSRDPDGTQHNQGDSLNQLVPGINGPTSKAAVLNADANLAQILGAIESDRSLRDTTDVFVTSDHGFATISKHEIDALGHASNAYATRFVYLGSNGQPEVRAGWLPPGFLAIDLAHALDLPLFDPDRQIQAGGHAHYLPVDPARPASAARAQRPIGGNGLIGGSGAVLDSTDAQVIVAANGGSDLIYVPGHDRALVQRIVDLLAQQDYTGALFVDPAFGTIPGALSMDQIGLVGSAQMPRPAIAVGFKTFATDPADPWMTAAQIADTTLQQGQGMHGSMGRDNTFNNMAAMGPDFKRGFVDRAPAGNEDIAQTLAQVLGLRLPSVGSLSGRVLDEALVGRPDRIASDRATVFSLPAPPGSRATALEYQRVGGQRYLDVACFVVAMPAATAGTAAMAPAPDGAGARDRPCSGAGAGR